MSSAKVTSILAALAIFGLGPGLGCKSKESNLEKMARDEGGQSKPDADAADGATAAASDGPPAEAGAQPSASDDGAAEAGDEIAPADHELDEHGLPVPPKQGAATLISPGADEDRVELRLALDEGSRYQITTIGMLELPLLNRPTGFARKEALELSACEGEGAGRSCLLTHTYKNYEAEPPAGTGLEADERHVAGLETAHRIDASGLRLTPTAVHGDSTPDIAKQLAEVHRLYCIRFPEQPVGVGATWRDLCRMRQGGSLVTRELTWRLASVEPGEHGRRAQLEYAGRVRRVDPKGKVVNGEVKGVLYFWLDAGEPHRLREGFAFVLNPDSGLGTKTDLYYEFYKLADDGETLTRTDGQALEQQPRALNDPRAVPAGATRDDEFE